MIAQNKRLFTILAVCTFILLVPLIAMQFTPEVVWTASDFLVAGALLFGTGLVIELTFRKIKRINQRTVAIVAIIVLILLLWMEMAVGLFGTPLAGD